MAGAASHGIKSEAGSVVHRGTGLLPDSGRGQDLCDACGVGVRGMEARRGSGRGRQRPQCGVLPDGTELPFKQSQEGDDPGSKQGTEAPRLPYGSSTVACATTAPGHSPVRAEGKPSPRAADPEGCAPKPACRAASASPGPPRPQTSRRRRWAPGRQPCPCPGCRVGRRRVTPIARSTFPSAPLRTGRAAFTASGSPVSCSSRLRYLGGGCTVLQWTPSMDVPVAGSAHDQRLATPCRHDLHPDGRFGPSFSPQVFQGPYVVHLNLDR